MPLEQKLESQTADEIIPIFRGGTTIVDVKPVITSDAKYEFNIYVEFSDVVKRKYCNYVSDNMRFVCWLGGYVSKYLEKIRLGHFLGMFHI